MKIMQKFFHVIQLLKQVVTGMSVDTESKLVVVLFLSRPRLTSLQKQWTARSAAIQ